MKHGAESFFIKGEGWLIGRLFSSALVRKIFSLFSSGRRRCMPPGSHGDENQDDDMDPVTRPKRAFCRLFTKGDQQNAEGLVELGLAMENEQGVVADEITPQSVPAGYTYLGQFIDHDITLDRTELSDSEAVDPATIEENFRTPQLDLDSLYLGGPSENPELYVPGTHKFIIGETSNVQGLGVFENDLPRKPDSTEANIGDGRNDENLIVAQTHLLFLKFHNSLVDAKPEATFEEIRKQVTEHYQAIILTDFLPRIVNQDVLNDVIANGRKFYTDDFSDCMPVEFSVAAYRMGHSMVRPTYEWNRIFSTTGQFGIATFSDIFEFSGGSGSRGAGDPPFRGLPSLPSNWIADWRRMYDMSTVTGEDRHPQMNVARKIDAQLALDLKRLPEFQKMDPPLPEPFISLAARNLLRGRLVSLPSGQDVANQFKEKVDVPTLTPGEIVQDLAPDQIDIVRRHGFDQQTPLWYYILREAKVQENGFRLGQLGSRIVAETFIGLIEHSPINVMKDKPGLSFSMPELINSLPGDINPLGD